MACLNNVTFLGLSSSWRCLCMVFLLNLSCHLIIHAIPVILHDEQFSHGQSPRHHPARDIQSFARRKTGLV